MRDKAPKHKGRGGAKKSHGVFDFFKKNFMSWTIIFWLSRALLKLIFVNIFTQRENDP